MHRVITNQVEWAKSSSLTFNYCANQLCSEQIDLKLIHLANSLLALLGPLTTAGKAQRVATSQYDESGNTREEALIVLGRLV